MSGELPKDQYCREVETYLCRKNHGHLIRLVGPAFERVCTWADRGIPIAVACRGIDRYVERQAAKSSRQRPARVEFCEADILDVFDEWRRAVGVTVTVAVEGEGATPLDESPAGVSRGSLSSHLERTLVALRAVSGAAAPLATVVERAVLSIDGIRSAAGTLRGAARQAALERLRTIDGELMSAVREHADPAQLAGILGEAERQLAPFKSRMPGDAHRRAMDACVDRLLRERAGVPVVAFE